MDNGRLTRVARVLNVLAGLARRPGMGIMEIIAGMSPHAQELASRGLRLNSPRYRGGGPERTVYSIHKAARRGKRYQDSGYPGSVRRQMIREGRWPIAANDTIPAALVAA